MASSSTPARPCRRVRPEREPHVAAHACHGCRQRRVRHVREWRATPAAPCADRGVPCRLPSCAHREIGAGLRFVGERDDRDFANDIRVTLPSYTLVDLTGEFALSPLSRALSPLTLTLRVENLFDRAYQQSFGYDSPGTAVFVGARVVLGARSGKAGSGKREAGIPGTGELGTGNWELRLDAGCSCWMLAEGDRGGWWHQLVARGPCGQPAASRSQLLAANSAASLRFSVCPLSALMPSSFMSSIISRPRES